MITLVYDHSTSDNVRNIQALLIKSQDAQWEKEREEQITQWEQDYDEYLLDQEEEERLREVEYHQFEIAERQWDEDILEPVVGNYWN